MPRIAELDAVRAVAAVAILLFHWRFHIPILSTAVDLFFVLSGYLITSILLDLPRTGRALGAFYARRALRILPIYYLAFAAFLILNRWSPRPHPTEALPWFLTFTQFTQGYWSEPTPPFSRAFGHTWTLAIEEQFYLAWPLAVLALRRAGVVMIGLPLLVLASLLRFRGLDPHLLLTRCDGLILGALLAAWLAGRRGAWEGRWRYGKALAALVALAAVPLAPWSGDPGWRQVASSLWLARVAVFYAGVVGLLVVYAGHPRLRPLRHRVLGEVGKMSYGLYLYHTPVFVLVAELARALDFHRPVRVDLVKLALTLVVARLSWCWLERPLLARKDRFGYGPGAPGPRPHLPAPHRGRREASQPAPAPGSRAGC